MKKIFLLFFLSLSFVAFTQTATELSAILSSSQKDLPITGQGSQLALNQNVILETAGTGSVDMQGANGVTYRTIDISIIPASGTVTAGAITFEASNDNFATAALPLFLYDLNTINTAPVSSYTIAASTSRHFGGKVPFRYIRARISTAITGTTTGVQANTFLKVSEFVPMVYTVNQPSAGNLLMTASQGGTWTVQPGNTANTTAWLVEQRTGTTNGSTTTTLNSAATTNATLVKASAGMIYYITANNTTASAKYVRIYNLTTAPTVGTSTPAMVITIPAASSINYEYSTGLKFATGISYAITGAATYLDATAVAAGDVQLLINYQ